eukprot:tig00000076_g2377.t1
MEPSRPKPATGVRSGLRAAMSRQLAPAPALSATQQQKEAERLRGFYSELIGGDASLEDVMTISHAVQPGPLLIQKNKPQGAPLASTFVVQGDGADVPTVPPSSELENVVLPSGEFHPLALEPKVMAPYHPGPGKTPRKIEIERKKRLFAAQRIEQLLEERGVTSEPPTVNGGPSFVSFLPLEAFDDTEFECRRPQEWMAMAMDGNVLRGVPGKALRTDANGESRWISCRMLDVNIEKNTYLVEWADTKDQIFVHRINLCFDAEDPFNFANRVASAHRARSQAEADLRYHLFIDGMPTDEIPQLSTEQTNRILASALNTKKLKEKPSVENDLLKEVNIEYARTMNRIVFDSGRMVDESDAYASLGLPPVDDVARVVAWSGVVQIPEHNFADQFGDFMFHSFLTKSEIINAIGKVKAECNRIRKSSLFFTQFSKSVRLEEFEQMEGQVCTQVSQDLKNNWITALKNGIKNSLKDVGKGWFNVHEKNKEVYELSKLKKFMGMINFMMQDSLRSLVQDSINQYVTFLTGCASSIVSITSPNDVTVVDPDPASLFKDEPKLYVSMVPRRCTEHDLEALFSEFGKIKSITLLRDPQGNFKCSAYVVFETKEEAHLAVSSLDGKHTMHGGLFPLQVVWAETEKQKQYKKKLADLGLLGLASIQTSNLVKRQPVFAVDLILRGNELKYGTPTNKFEEAPLTLFDKAVQAVQDIPQLEPKVMEHLFWAHIPNIGAVHPLEEWVVAARDVLREALRRALVPLHEYLKSYDKFGDLLKMEASAYMAQYEDANYPVQQMKTDILKFRDLAQNVEKSIPLTVSVGMFLVNCQQVRSLLADKYQEIARLIQALLVRKAKEKCDKVMFKFGDISRQLQRRPPSIEELIDLKKYIGGIPDMIEQLQKEIEDMLTYYDVLEEFKHNLAPDEFDNKWNAFAWPLRLQGMVTTVVESLQNDQGRMQTDMVGEQERFKRDVDDLHMLVSNFAKHTDIAKVKEVALEVKKINAQLQQCQAKARLFNTREQLFEMPITEYSSLNKIVKDFEPYSQLWLTTNDWLNWKQVWLNDPFTSLNPEKMEKDLNGAWKIAYKLQKHFQDIPGCRDIANQIKAEMDEFKPVLPLVAALRNPGMRDRHWEQLSKDLGFQIKLDETSSLVKVQQMNLQDHLETIQRVGESAGKEYAIEQALDKMAKEWENIQLELVEYRETGTFVLRGSDEIFQMLDDHIVMTQSMNFSPFKKAFEERISTWEQKLTLASNILEEWLGVQRQWLYLEPIFGSEDIMKQLPTEGKRFTTVDRTWRKTMQNAKMNPHVLGFCNSEKLLESFQESNKLLDMVQKGLSDYLETKRAAFARFYFLSNDELLEILSQTKDPKAVQPHLRKCFENVHSLEFIDQPQGLPQITAMFSAEKERIPFLDVLYPKGNVEIWLSEVEASMKRAIRNQIKESLADYLKIPRGEWVVKWPGQVVLCGSQTHWTKEVQEAIMSGGAANVKKYYEGTVLPQLLTLTELVRGSLPPLARLTLGALIVIDVHARDVVGKLIEANVASENDFEWVSQLRYYWEHEEVIVRQVNCSYPYGYEYLGNTARLVITPLTDRCYMTLMGALHMNLGGAPAGPAGTGKTETTKDLAKALAKQCVVFNCSDGLDYLAMGKFFKGLASAGAWACFDEFNRIDIEVLSVVAQQITTIQKAIQNKVKRFMFEGTEIPLNPTCAVFITMNPGYAGRTELPDNLKALFRPMSMMVPDYALIAEISLFSFGFSEAKINARKIVTTFKLSSEQLSSQDHYDFGMRAVKSVINAAGNLKREDPDMNEEILVLRAIRDVNQPKFLSEDLPLFDGIISDLFPGLQKPKVDYGDLELMMKEATVESGLQTVDSFLVKCMQLYETTIVRHGLMLVGPTGGGKTACYNVLAKAMSKLHEHERFAKVKIYTLNPKSITMGQLYGQFDDATHEWTDGILAKLVRLAAGDTAKDKKWIMFDGPVDAIWIENMNTVLDDNKKLCLNSGEIIQLTPTMTMMFEVEDLAVASPATVSRCGMVYIEPKSLGVEPLFESWSASLPPLAKGQAEHLRELFNNYVPDLLHFLRKHLKEPCPTVDTSLVQGLFNILNCFFAIFVAHAHAKHEDEGHKLPELAEVIDGIFIYALIWSIGGTTDRDGRAKFHAHLRARMEKMGCKQGPPDTGLVYDYKFNIETKEWVQWMSTIPEYKLDAKAPFADMIVPTADSVRSAFLLDLLLQNQIHALCVGETGTGKTVVVSEKLLKGMSEVFIPVFITFSARTSANQTQDLIDSKMDKRRKGVFGPPAGKKYIIFIDDLNMPAREKYFAQPPIELLRQWMDHKGWYDRKTLEFKQIIDVSFVGAMGPPGGGRNPVTNRFIRHFNMMSFTELENDSLSRIFNTILSTFLTSIFPTNISNVGQNMVKASIEVYQTICVELLPTPAKSHYTFNLRDLAKVIQGILNADEKKVAEPQDLVRLWCHESLRVFSDRLVNNEDRDWFRNLLKGQMRKHFSMEWDDVVTTERLIYGDFLVPGADPKVYTEISDLHKLQRIVEEYLEDYNNQTNKPMKLVMFLDAIEHVARICRIIRQPGGNALLLGVGGSGRQSLTRLAAFMEEFELFQVEISKGYGNNEWREDLRRCLKKAGMNATPVVFLFSDTQIVNEGFLEDVNNILNSGEVPNLMGGDDMEEIVTAMRPVCAALGLPLTKTGLYSQFISRVKSSVHVVLCMSPIGEVFRNRLRMFPSLVNCCTIDWFSEWPEEALRSVAKNFLADVQLGSAHVQQAMIDMCVYVHQSVERKSRQFLAELRRHNYTTPTSYLELLSTYQTLLGEKRSEVGNLRKRLEIGLEKLLDTAKEVEVLQNELVALQPVLAKAVEETDSMMVQIARDKEEADQTKETVEEEEKTAATKAEETKAIADDAQRDLDEALPALEAAVASLKNLNRNDIVEVRSMQRPPAGVKLVMEAVCIMQNQKPKKIDDPNKMGKKIDDYWEPAKGLLADPNKFLESLFNFDKDNIPESVIQKIDPYIEMPDFQVESVAKVSKACTAICLWTRSMYKYYHVARSVAPKRERLRIAQESLEQTMKILNDAKARLKSVQEKIAELEAKYNDSLARKEELSAKVTDCSLKLDRAQKLIGGLGGEKDRWSMTVKELETAFTNLVGDVMVAGSTIAYLGAFTAPFRNSCVREWQLEVAKRRIPHTAGCSLRSTLADPVKIRAWTLDGLPTDNFSVENGIITSKTRRWPLMIDPQGVANKWIKNMEKERSLDIIKLTDKDYLRTLENSIRFGRPVVLEDIGEELESALEPVLLKQVFKQGGSDVIRLGENVIPYHPDFRFYMTTKLPNPHYKPEVAVKVTLLNFTATPEGLEEQLLGIVVEKERPDLEEQKNALMVSNAKMKKELKELEDKILFLLSNSQGNILDDEVLIETLAQSKKTSEEISAKVAEAEKTEREIDGTRQLYRPVALRASILFFCIADLNIVDPMYQYSLQWFTNLFVSGIVNAPAAESLDSRLTVLNDYFTYSLYVNICRSLFEKHKLLFSFMLCIAILKGMNRVDAHEWRFLLAGPTQSTPESENPAPEWLSEKSWQSIHALSKLEAFGGLEQDFVADINEWKTFFDDDECHRSPLPGDWNGRLNTFQKMLVLRSLRMDRVTPAIQEFVAEELGQRFIEPPPFDLASAYKDSSPLIPLIFVLSTGADPAAELYRFAEEMRFGKKLHAISLGQGQGPIAEKMITEAMERGTWVLLQNCHLAVSWMPALERIVANMKPDGVHRDFRLWLTSMPSPKFPVLVLQNGVKMTNEPPKGLKANIMRSFLSFDDTFLSESKKPDEWKKLLFALCMFHAIIQERRKFGALGWNIAYEFNQSDLSVCIKQLHDTLDEYAQIPYKVLKVQFGDINYGGRVTDDWDRRTLMTILDDYCNPQLLEENYIFSPSGTYQSISAQNLREYLEYIRSLPTNPAPEVFGLHENADITCAENETIDLLSTIVTMQPRTGSGGGKSREDTLAEVAAEILERTPAPFPVDDVQERYPTMYSESLNTVLVQEVIRYNRLLVVMKKSLKDFSAALKGLVVMSEALEKMGNALFDNQVPEMWTNNGLCYPSLKPLASWVTDLEARIHFIQKWIDGGVPNVFWFSGFFFPQAFLTGVLQNFARKYGLPIDTISYSFNVVDTAMEETLDKPEDGCYVRGLFLEGARWDYDSHVLTEAKPKELYSEMPIMHWLPSPNRVKPTEGIYDCPCYKILTRQGTLSTTGHSTNFVLTVEVPSDKPQAHWIKRGVALVTSLRY